MDGDDNVVGYSIEDLAISMNQGSNFFTNGDYVLAGYCFRDSRDISIQIHGEFSCECAIAHYDYGLSLLCQVPLLQNDPMYFLPKEVDYYQSKIKPYPSHGLSRYLGTMGDCHRKILEDAKRELDLAWSIMEYKSDDYDLGKAYILSALGEAAFRGGEPNPQHYYSEALSIFERLYGEQNMRIADMYPLLVWFRISLTIYLTLCLTVYILASEFRNAKLLICFEGIARSKAIEYGTKAWFFYETLGRLLLSKIPNSSTPAAPIQTATKRRVTSLVTQIDPSIEKKRGAANRLLGVTMKLKDKLDRLKTVIPAGDRDARGGAQINTNLEL